MTPTCDVNFEMGLTLYIFEMLGGVFKTSYKYLYLKYTVACTRVRVLLQNAYYSIHYICFTQFNACVNLLRLKIQRIINCVNYSLRGNSFAHQ